LRSTAQDVIDRPILVRRHGAPALPLRLVALRKSPTAAEAARRTARRAGQKGGHQVSKETLDAADWVIAGEAFFALRSPRSRPRVSPPPTSSPSTACAGASNSPSSG